MKIKIDKDGHLLIDRAGKMKLMACPFSYDKDLRAADSPCGDWCPLFHEFEIDGKPAIELCRAYFPEGEIEELVDERGGE